MNNEIFLQLLTRLVATEYFTDVEFCWKVLCLLVLLYGHETRTVALRIEYRLRVLEKTVLEKTV